MISTVDRVKLQLGLTGTSSDALIEQLLEVANAAAITYIRRGWNRTAFPNWPESGSGTEYYTGSGTRELLLNFLPVPAVASVYLDQTGYYGDGSGAFAPSTLLTVGQDYVLKKDDGTGASASGILLRLGGFSGNVFTNDWGFWPPENYGRGTLTARRAPCWPTAPGCIKVTYTAGFTAGNIPDDLQGAVDNLAVVLYNRRATGQLLQSETMGQYSYTLGDAAETLGTLPALGGVRATLNAYRDMARF